MAGEIASRTGSGDQLGKTLQSLMAFLGEGQSQPEPKKAAGGFSSEHMPGDVQNMVDDTARIMDQVQQQVPNTAANLFQSSNTPGMLSLPDPALDHDLTACKALPGVKVSLVQDYRVSIHFSFNQAKLNIWCWGSRLKKPLTSPMLMECRFCAIRPMKKKKWRAAG